MIPTLAADQRLRECLASLESQTMGDYEVIVVDNSGKQLVSNQIAPECRVIHNSRNLGFGEAINQGFRASNAPLLATLNDDAVPAPGWLAALVAAIDARPDVGMCASRVRFFAEDRLDSAGMLVAGDGSSKQRGHDRPLSDFPVLEVGLFPSGSAALFRRTLLEEVGGFDADFFLYCEDTDLGLRARWAGWKCLYVPDALVEHHYSHSAGRASPVKAYYVERNRLFVLAKNFPLRMLVRAPFITFARYFWHAVYLMQGKGSAARFRAEGHAGPRMLWYIVRAHAALFAAAPRLWRQRRQIHARAKITAAVFEHLMRSYSIRARRIAAL